MKRKLNNVSIHNISIRKKISISEECEEFMASMLRQIKAVLRAKCGVSNINDHVAGLLFRYCCVARFFCPCNVFDFIIFLCEYLCFSFGTWLVLGANKLLFLILLNTLTFLYSRLIPNPKVASKLCVLWTFIMVCNICLPKLSMRWNIFKNTELSYNGFFWQHNFWYSENMKLGGASGAVSNGHWCRKKFWRGSHWELWLLILPIPKCI